MVCVHCGAKTHVFNSRSQKRLNQVWRRRECFNCEAVFTTVETAQYASAWRVQTKDGTLTPYNDDKLFLSLYESCKHRQNPLRDARALTETVTSRLADKLQHDVITSTAIAQVAQVALNRFDRAASVHYAAFHQG